MHLLLFKQDILEHYPEKYGKKFYAKKFSLQKDLPVLPMGTINDLKTGEWVAAIGSPFHLTNTVTVGVVSSTQRDPSEMGLPHKNIKYIQTDASITVNYNSCQITLKF